MTDGRPPGRRSRRQLLLIAVEVATPLAVIVGLTIWTENARIYYFPPLADILLGFPRFWFVEHLTSDVLPSLSRLAAGFGIAVGIGVPFGLLLGRYERLRALSAPILEFVRAIPAPALIPLVILLIGLGDDAKIALIAAVCVWPVLLNAMDGAAGTEPMYLEAATTYRVPTWRRFTRIVLPAALPQIFSGIRTAVALALIMVVVSEMVASQNGIGQIILVSQRTFALSSMWSGIILLGILGYLLNLLFLQLERWVLAWHHGSRAQPE